MAALASKMEKSPAEAASCKRSVLPLTLYTHGPSWGLESVDPVCLAVARFLQLSHVQFSKVFCNNPAMSPSGRLPLIRCNNETIITSYDDLRHLCKDMGIAMDGFLTHGQTADAAAYECLVETAVGSALTYETWCESANFDAVALPQLVSSRLAFPLDIVVAWMQRVSARRLILRDRRQQSPTHVYDTARQAFVALSDRLGSAPFLFGERPCSSDLLVYAYLKCVQCYPLTTSVLADALARHQNLTNFVKRVDILA